MGTRLGTTQDEVPTHHRAHAAIDKFGNTGGWEPEYPERTPQ